MKYDIPQLLKDSGIALSTEGHNAAQGWVQIQCPYCQDPSDHLGYNITGDYFSCWRCGAHSIKDTLVALLEIPWIRITQLLNQYCERPIAKEQKDKILDKPFTTTLPPEAEQMTSRHRNYLTKRNFNPIFLQNQYGLLGTNHLGDYNFRIIAPIYHQGKLVSYQGRDITNRSELKYKTCRGDKETRPHKHCLYGLDDIQYFQSVMIVEGITDVWRMGEGAVATFGLTVTLPQIKLLTRFTHRYIMLDSGENEFKRSKELAAKLGAFNGKNTIVELKEGDPASLSQEEADNIMRELIY